MIKLQKFIQKTKLWPLQKYSMQEMQIQIDDNFENTNELYFKFIIYINICQIKIFSSMLLL